MTSIETTLEERGNRYGVFAEHARITQNMKRAMIDSPNWQRLQDDQRECLEMLAGRALNGDPDYHDSWHDIIGYTKLVADRLALAAETFGPSQDVFTLDEINQMIDELNAVDAGPMTEEEETEYKPELTYGDHAKALEKRGVSRIDLQAINHAHIEPRDRSDVAGNEVQPIGIKLRESAAHDWMYNDDAEKLIMFDVINGRYENQRPTIVLSNYPMESPRDLNGKPTAPSVRTVLGDRVMDRLRRKRWAQCRF